MKEKAKKVSGMKINYKGGFASMGGKRKKSGKWTGESKTNYLFDASKFTI